MRLVARAVSGPTSCRRLWGARSGLQIQQLEAVGLKGREAVRLTVEPGLPRPSGAYTAYSRATQWPP